MGEYFCSCHYPGFTAINFIGAKAAGKSFLETLGFKIMALMDLLSIYSAVNASLLRSDKRKLSPYKRRTFASIFERKIWEKGKEGLFITAGLVILIANFLPMKGTGILASASLIIIYITVNASHCTF